MYFCQNWILNKYVCLWPNEPILAKSAEISPLLQVWHTVVKWVTSVSMVMMVNGDDTVEWSKGKGERAQNASLTHSTQCKSMWLYAELATVSMYRILYCVSLDVIEPYSVMCQDWPHLHMHRSLASTFAIELFDQWHPSEVCYCFGVLEVKWFMIN